MKKAIEWFNQLPEPERTNAINNIKPDLLEYEFPNFIKAISGAFTWRSTKQGFDYWRDIYNRYNE